jgi:phytoene desaturase
MTAKYIRNDKLRRVFSFQPLLVGGNPFNTTSIYSLIQYLEREWGVWFAMGGTGAIVEGLRRLMVEEGIDIRLGQEVEEVETTVGPPFSPIRWCYTSGVRLRSGERIEAQGFLRHVIVCNADAPFVYRHMINKARRRRTRYVKWTDRRIGRLKYSMGLFVLYFGTKRQYPDVAHHTIILGERYKELLHEMFDLKRLATEDFSIYLHRPTATDPSMAPPGCDSFYVLCPVPNLQGDVDWKTMGPRYRDLIVEYLEQKALPGLRGCITEDFHVTPEHFRDNLNTLHGTGFSIQPTFTQSAYFRFHNKSEDVEGLYFVGAGTHPGAGMPGVLCSAKVLEHVLPPRAEDANPVTAPGWRSSRSSAAGEG